MPSSPLVPTLVVNVPGSGDTVVLALTNAPEERPQTWQVGRASDCAVRVVDPRVSKHHATICAEPRTTGQKYDESGARQYLWLFRDNGSTNGSWHGSIQIGGRGIACLWLEIEEGTTIRIANTKIRFSFLGHFGDDEDTDSGPAVADDPPTVVEPLPTIDADDLWDIVALILTGPKTTANWLWWTFLAISGAALFLTLEIIKK